ncbi:MAG: GntR family transcriptional regulator, partial [Bacteroidaceae bacterium]|nr:GntR family transcriptional regulator [Bacteroidaceae bacterium]
NVFIYLDQEERLIATTLEPLVKVGEFAYLEVAWVNQFGAFLDWGLMKDLFVPFREQKMKMLKGHKYVVHCHIDEDSYRIMASAKIEKFLSDEMPDYNPGDEVEVLVYQKTDLGFKVIVENKFSGMLYQNELFQYVHSGDRLTAFVKQVRPDGKIDLKLQNNGRAQISEFSNTLLEYIKAHDGHCRFHDKSSTDEIYNEFEVSKKVFKKAVGDLYKQHLIVLKGDDGIYLA